MLQQFPDAAIGQRRPAGLVVSQAESTGIHRVFFRLAALLVVAWLAMRPPRALPDKKIHRCLLRQFNLTDY
jgi:hypothetical protein